MSQGASPMPRGPANSGVNDSKRGRLAAKWSANFQTLLEETLADRRTPKVISVAMMVESLNLLTSGAGVSVRKGYLNEPFGRWIRRQMSAGHLVPTLSPGWFRNKVKAPNVRQLMGLCAELRALGAIVAPDASFRAQPRASSGATSVSVERVVLDIWATGDLAAAPALYEKEVAFHPLPSVSVEQEALELGGGEALDWMRRALEEGANDGVQEIRRGRGRR